MKTTIILLLTMILTTITVNATLTEKPLNISIPNCYNVNITVSLEQGERTELQFTGCNKINDNKYTCPCHNLDNNNFSIIMQTDNTIIRDIRQYDIFLTVTYMELNKKTLNINVEDGGDYYNTNKNEWTDYKKIPKIEYKNITVYIPEYINQTQIQYIDRNITINNTEIQYVNQTIYKENTTQIKELKEENIQFRTSLIITTVVTILLGILLITTLIKSEKKQ